MSTDKSHKVYAPDTNSVAYFFHFAFSIPEYIESNGGKIKLISHELERVWKEMIVAYLRYYPGTCLEVPMKGTKHLK
jgi:hypothetical protein